MWLGCMCTKRNAQNGVLGYGMCNSNGTGRDTTGEFSGRVWNRVWGDIVVELTIGNLKE